ncbi:hypothetical protein RRG08_044177 [Elysia crispata]|uniref:Uncharacterized protein n=1 Tax=Elysia crispata TaxID=231223 RepID=A0AAE0XX10_9GAST|nr:hypothetical protein RRG08_044177 [Elysia crispata]
MSASISSSNHHHSQTDMLASSSRPQAQHRPSLASCCKTLGPGTDTQARVLATSVVTSVTQGGNQKSRQVTQHSSDACTRDCELARKPPPSDITRN